MATEIDSLQIEINSKAEKANAAIDRLVSKLDRLTTSLSKLNTGNLTSLASGVDSLGKAMQTMNNVKTADFSRLATNLSKLGNINTSSLNVLGDSISRLTGAFNNIGTASANFQQIETLASSLSKFGNKGISNATNNIPNLAKSVNELGKTLSSFEGINISENVLKISELSEGIKKLGSTASTKAIDNIPKLAKAMKELMEELSKAPKVSQNIIEMTNALAKLSRTGSSSGKAVNSLNNVMDSYSRKVQNSSAKTTNLLSSLGKVTAIYYTLKNLASGFTESIDIASSLTESQNVVDTTFGSYANLVEEMSKTSIGDFGMSELTVKKVSSRFQAMGTAVGIAQGKMADMSLELTKLTGDMASFYNVSQEDMATSLQSVFTGETEPLRKYGLDLTQATLQEWAMKQGIDANISSMSQMEKVLLRYQYVMANTKTAQGDFAKTAGTWANQIRILQESFKALGGIVGQVLINVFKPFISAMNVMMQQVINFARVISNALGKIFGWTYEESSGGIASDFEIAADATGDIATGTGKAADNIKKMKAGLRAFDELNTINLNNNNSSNGNGNGSGTGASSPSATDSGQWAKTDSILKDFESDINNLYDLGKHIGDTLTDAMNSIDWNKAYESARNFGKGLADFLNGLISPELFGAVGRTIAGSLNVAIYNALSFGETFDWINLGNSFAEGVTQLFSTLDTEALGKTITVWVRGALKSVSTFLKKTDFEMIGNKIGELLKEMDLSGIAQDLADVLWELFKAAFELLKGMIDVAPLETAIVASLAGMKFFGLGSKISGALKKAILGEVSTTGTAQATGSSLGSKIFSSLSSTWTSLGGLGGILTTDLGTIVGAGTLTEIGMTVATGIVGGVAAGFAGLELGKFIGKSVAPEEFADYYDNFKFFGDGGFFDEISDDWGITMQASVDMADDLTGGLLTSFLNKHSIETDLYTNKIIEFGTYTLQMGTIWNKNFLDATEKMGKTLDDGMVGVVNKADYNLSNVGSVFKKRTKEINKDWSTSTSFIGKTIGVVMDKVGKEADKTMGSISYTLEKGMNLVNSKLSAKTSAMQAIWEGNNTFLKKSLKDTIDTTSEVLINGLNLMNTQIGNGTSSMISKISESAVRMGSEVASQVGNIKTTMESTKSSMESLWNTTTESINKGITTSVRSMLVKTTGGLNGIIEGFEGLIRAISLGTNSLIAGVNASLGRFTSSPVKSFNPLLNIGRLTVPSFETGGYIPKSYSMFMAGENGIPEIMGTVGGKSAVAGGVEITGIKDAIYSTSTQEVQLMREQNSLLRALLEKETGISEDAIFRSVKKSASDYTKRTGRPAF